MVELGKYNNQEYDPGAGGLKRILWYVVNAVIFSTWLLPVSSIKCFILRLFGADVGQGVVIKPRVNIKYPWNVSIGDHVWIGEGVWIDSLDRVTIKSNVCISQDAYLLTGNHNYKLVTFDLMLAPIEIQDGAWIGARVVVCPGSVISTNTVLTVGSVYSGVTEVDSIYRGNPAVKIKNREMMQ